MTNTNTEHAELVAEYRRTRDAYAAAVEAYGWDDPRTIDLEQRDAELTDLYVSLVG